MIDDRDLSVCQQRLPIEQANERTNERTAHRSRKSSISLVIARRIGDGQSSLVRRDEIQQLNRREEYMH